MQARVILVIAQLESQNVIRYKIIACNTKKPMQFLLWQCNSEGKSCKGEKKSYIKKFEEH